MIASAKPNLLQLFLKTFLSLCIEIMTAFFPEKLVPFIRVTRGLKACDNQQLFKVLQQLPELFKKHDATSVLMDIILAGIRNPKCYEKIPAALLVDVNASLPSDDLLHLQDSIYESRLMDKPNKNKATTNHGKKKLPLTLLRIPSDLQYHLFHFLDYKELINVQKVCRALCIAARNPSSIYSMKVDLRTFLRDHKLFSEWVSRPRSLAILVWPPKRSPHSIIGNTKWGHQVAQLSITSYSEYCSRGIDLQNLGHFGNLTKCEIRNFPPILLNGQITSYSTLKKLILEGEDWTENIIDEIRKFKNLEHLSFESDHSYHENENSTHSDPISFTRLRDFAIKFCQKVPSTFHRILIGSHPPSVNVKVSSMHEKCTLPETNAAVQAIRAIKYLKIDVSSMHFINALHLLLRRAQKQEFPFLEQCGLSIHIERDREISLPPIITLFQCANQSKLKLNFWDTFLSPKYAFERFVKEICNAPYGTFNEIKVNINVSILTSKMDDVYWSEDVLTAIETEESSKGDRHSVRTLVMKSIDKLEEWVRAWLWFDEERIKQIGIQKLEIEFKCNLDQNNEHWVIIDDQDWTDEVEAKSKRVDAVLDTMADEWIQQRAERWSYIDERCTTKVDTKNQEYTVTLTLKSRA